MSSNDRPSVSGNLKYTYIIPIVVIEPYNENTPDRPSHDFKPRNVFDVMKPIMYEMAAATPLAKPLPLENKIIIRNK